MIKKSVNIYTQKNPFIYSFQHLYTYKFLSDKKPLPYDNV